VKLQRFDKNKPQKLKQFFFDSVRGVSVVDKSDLYLGFKDFNDMTMKISKK